MSLPVRKFDAIIVGAGGAGMRASPCCTGFALVRSRGSGYSRMASCAMGNGSVPLVSKKLLMSRLMSGQCLEYSSAT